MLGKLKGAAISAAAGVLCATAFGSAQAVTPFQQDVTTAINNGLNYLDTTYAAYSNPGNGAGYIAGLTTLVLLEKRASGIPTDPPQGYNGASAADQARLRRSVAYIVGSLAPVGIGFYAYRDGGALSALSEYLLTGGPDTCGAAPNPNACPGTTPAELQNIPHSIQQTIDDMVDRTLSSQRTVANHYVTGTPAWDQGYWCYTDGSCRDSSTTQYAALGLSAAQAVYNNPTFGDPGARLPKIAAALALARQAYELNLAQGSKDPACDPGVPASGIPGYKTTPNGSVNGVPADPNAYGHGYHSSGENYEPSSQQTASGMFVQVLGGSNINSPMVQGYMRWIYDHYRYTDIGGVNGAGDLYNSWPESYPYYLWSSFKGIEFMSQQGIAPGAGSLTLQSYGTLPPASAPTCTDRQLHVNPTTVSRVPMFGAGGAGFYGAETQSQYFDYAFTLLGYQCPSGLFGCNSGSGLQWSGTWSTIDGQVYALLVLQRATGVILPTATLTASVNTAPVGTPVNLTWGSTNANSCAASDGTAGDGWTGNNLATSGTLPVTETSAGTYTYTVTCSAGSQNAQAQVSVTFTGVQVLMCDVTGPNGSADGQVDKLDISAIQKMLGQKVAPNGPAPAAADPMGAGVITAQDARACALRCTHTSCATQ